MPGSWRQSPQAKRVAALQLVDLGVQQLIGRPDLASLGLFSRVISSSRVSFS